MNPTLLYETCINHIENESDFITAVVSGLKGQKKSQVQFENYTWDYISKMIDEAYR